MEGSQPVDGRSKITIHVGDKEVEVDEGTIAPQFEGHGPPAVGGDDSNMTLEAKHAIAAELAQQLTQ